MSKTILKRILGGLICFSIAPLLLAIVGKRDPKYPGFIPCMIDVYVGELIILGIIAALASTMVVVMWCFDTGIFGVDGRNDDGIG